MYKRANNRESPRTSKARIVNNEEKPLWEKMNRIIFKKNFCLNTRQIFVLLEISQKTMSGLLAKNQSGEKEEKQIF